MTESAGKRMPWFLFGTSCLLLLPAAWWGAGLAGRLRPQEGRAVVGPAGLQDVIDHHKQVFGLARSDQDKNDLIQYLLGLGEPETANLAKAK